MRLWFIVIVLGLLFSPTVSPSNAQSSAVCGVVDSIGYPIDNLVAGYDDFARFRQRFGGNHTGVDIGFDRWGEPVYAAARGRVTYADPEGWDTEKGVVIIEHTFPDNSVAYGVYGHMEETDTIGFPQVGQCVEKGNVVGTIGWPSLGRPHLHYELRRFLPDDGGPGYVTTNPLDEGWYNPQDFTTLWQARFNPAYRSSITFNRVPSLPPVQLDTGEYVIASGNELTAIAPPNQVLWRIQTDGLVDGLAGLSGGRIAAHTASGQAVVLQGGRYAALWSVRTASTPFLTNGDTLVFLTQDGGLAAYDSAGTALWSLAGTSGAEIVNASFNGGQVGLTLRSAAGITWKLLDSNGQTLAELPLSSAPVTAPGGSGWAILDNAQLLWQGVGTTESLASLNPLPGSSAQLTVDVVGNTYIYLGDVLDTLMAVDPSGHTLWQVTYPRGDNGLAPLMRTGRGCLLYSLDADGLLNVFNTADGKLITQMHTYAGGSRDTNPQSRLLTVNDSEQIQVMSGYITLLTLDGFALGGDAANCTIG